MVEIKHLNKTYANVTPLKDVNAVINDGDIISIIGPSGTGKSTLIRCINLLDQPTAGQIIVNGLDITSPDCNISEVRRKMGMVFQGFNLFGHLTVIENVMFGPMQLLGMSKQDAYDKGMKLLHQVGMDGWAMNYPEMLSGGQKQRVAIARTLSMDPDIILFDEPTSALDPTMVGEVQSVIKELAGMGKTMMIVTHEMKFAREICNRVFYMDEGGIYEDGTPEQIFDNPQKERTRQFIRQLKMFKTVIDGPTYDFIGIVAQMEQYAFKNKIPYNTAYHIRLLFEELCHNILLDEDPRRIISFTIEYDAEKDEVSAIILFSGDPYDPQDSDNVISKSIMNNITKCYRYEYLDACDAKDAINGVPLTNRLTVIVL